VVPGIPETCGELDAAAVPVLPRASNDEIRQLYTDLVGEPIDADLFARWTPLAQVRGFDTMTESRIDAQTLEEQLRTTEAVASLLVRSTTVMARCPAPTSLAPVCALHDSYDATGQFSSVQGQDCWSFLDGAGTPLTYDGGRQLWVASDPGLFIWNTGLHPGIGIDVIRRWTAPSNGTVVLRGSIFDADGGGGDGIVVDIRAPAGSVFRAVIVNGGAAESRTIRAAASTGAASRVRPNGAWRGRGAHAAAARTAVRRVARGRSTVEPSCASVSHLRQRDGLRRAVDEATRVPGRARAAVRRRARRRHRRPALARRRPRSRRRPVGQRAHEANLFARAGPEELRVAVLRERCAVRLVRQPFAPPGRKAALLAWQ
jgi:hypothetical protein